MCCIWQRYCYRSLVAILRKKIGKPRKEIRNLNGFEYKHLNGLKVPYYSTYPSLSRKVTSMGMTTWHPPLLLNVFLGRHHRCPLQCPPNPNGHVSMQVAVPCCPLMTYGGPCQIQAPPHLPPEQLSSPAPAPTPALEPALEAIKEDVCHPKLRTLMDPKLQWHNNFINLSEIITSSGKCMTDLPSLSQFCLPTGAPLICWNSLLGKYFRGSRCKNACGQLKKCDATDTIANLVSDVIMKWVLHYTSIPVN
jgi:hypothetical protein